MRTSRSFNHPGLMKDRKRSSSATTQKVSRGRSDYRRPVADGRSERGVPFGTMLFYQSALIQDAEAQRDCVC